MKILMATMSLGIGGAETHIIELSIALKRMGVDVSVASNGGAYVKRLTENGIRHFTVPLNSKKPSAVAKSLNFLYKNIKEEKYDIVHSHARIPCFICKILSHFLSFHFVSTCHYAFDMNPLWRLCADWGERTLAVSADLKDYLIKNYSVPSSQISLTINGINSEEYTKYRGERENICRQFGLDTSCHKRIVYVSRLDAAACCVGFMLIDAMERINSAFPNCELVIIGGGDSYERMKELAENKNAMLGRKAITLTGPSTDVPRLLHCGDIFVGVSRAALEGMAAGLPTIIAGAFGYFGIFDKSCLKKGLQTNFTARGYTPPDSEKLSADIISLFSKSESELAAISQYNKSIVNEYYPVRRMAQDAMDMYSSLTPLERDGKCSVVISGYYGYGNTGDDSLLSVIVNNLRRNNPDLQITVLSAKPKETAKLYNVNAISRFNILKIAKALENAKLFINGSGNLLQNVTSSRSLFYYVTLMKLAKKMHCKVMLYAGGLGPINGSWAEKVTKGALDICDTITLRETLSMDVMNKIGADTSNVKITADPAILIKPDESGWIDYIMKKNEIAREFFIVALRSWKDNSTVIASCTEAVKVIEKRYGIKAVYVVMQKSHDEEITNRCAQINGSPVLSGLNASELCGIFRLSKFVIAMRLHTLVYAASVNIPFLGICYDEKVKGMCDRYNDKLSIALDGLTGENILSSVDYIMTDYENIKKKIEEKSAQLKELALTDGTLAGALIK